MKIKKLKLTKTVLRNLDSEDQKNLQGGSDHFCTSGCTAGGFTCLAQTCGCSSGCDTGDCDPQCTTYIIC